MESSLRELAMYRMERTFEMLIAAEDNLKIGQYKTSLNRSYYAIFHAMRAANIIKGFDSSKHSGVIAFFNKEYLKENIIDRKMSPIIKNSSFFKGLTDDEILSILHCVEATAVSKERDSYIFRAADSTEVMGLVVSGCVLVIQEDLWGHRNILSKCHTGDFFGEPYAASPGAVLNVSVVADTDCEIILLNVQRLLISCPTATRQMSL